MKNSHFFVRLLALAFCCCLLFFNSCDKQIVTAEGGIIILTAQRLNLDLNESITITIRGYNENGTMMWDGTRIDLSVENGTLDKLFAEISDGSASVTASADVERGSMKIYARSGNVEGELDITVNEVEQVGRITINLDPAILPYTGGRTQVLVRVFNDNLEPMTDTSVVLETTTGTLDSQGASVRTNSEGAVTDYLTATAAGQITAYAGDKTQTAQVTLDNEPTPNEKPVADFSFSPTKPISNEIVYFNASASYDPDGTIRTYHWDFGDGSSARGKTVNHTYDSDGITEKTYTVTLTVYDQEDAHDAESKTITIYTKAT
ncbi:MAG: PKD domain-containing protein [bacterium]|nr:PKD domain-containing protein [bacterium]